MEGDVKILEGNKWSIESEASLYIQQGYRVVSAVSAVLIATPLDIPGTLPMREVIHTMILVKEPK